MTFDLAQAEELAKVVQKTGVVFAVTHNYTGYPLVRQAREMVQAGELGEINAVRAFYIQGWLRTRLETRGQKQAGWRTDPKKSGAAGCFGDIGTHAYNLGRFITGLLPEQISCQLKAFEPGRSLDDYGTAIVRYHNGAPRHRHRLADFARPGKRPVDRGGWHQGVAGMAPGGAEQDARFASTASRTRFIRAPAARTSASWRGRSTRIPSGHPGGVSRSFRQHLHRGISTT